MRSFGFAAVALGLLGCTPGLVPQRAAQDPRVFSGTPRCAYEVLGTFSRAPELQREIERRGGDAVIQVREEPTASGANPADGTAVRFYSGQVVRFTDPACKV